MKPYSITEIFSSLQGEGLRAGTSNIFIRFSSCNLRCNGEEVEGQYQPVCDTEFSSFRRLTLEELIAEAERLAGSPPRAVILTGGEPALQVDNALVSALKSAGFFIAIETNGTKPLPEGIDWICCSPKTAEHTLKLERANELKYIRRAGMGIPRPAIHADHYLISPAVQPDGQVLREDLEWCLALVKDNPLWRLSCQQHKLIWRVR